MSNRKMSKYITEQMFTHSDTAIENHFTNNFGTLGQFNIACFLCQKILDPICDYYKPKALDLSSGFRGKDLNTKVGGDIHSDHCISNVSNGGTAADINFVGLTPKQLFNDIFTGKIKQPSGKPLTDLIDQLIYEERHTFQGIQRWVHVGHRNVPRKQFMMSLDGKTYSTVTHTI